MGLASAVYVPPLWKDCPKPLADDWPPYKKTAYKFDYYGSLCKLYNVCQVIQSKLFKRWMGMFGCESAMRNVSTNMPRPISGRWQAVHNTERYLSKCDDGTWQAVVKGEFEKQPLSEIQPIQDGDGDVPHIDETDHYKQQMGRWRTNVYDLCVSHHPFWALVHLSYTAMSPLDGLANFMKSKGACPNHPWLGGIHIAQMIGWRVDQTMQEFHSMLQPESPWQQVVTTMLLEQDRDWVKFAMMDLILTHAMETHKRFIVLLRLSYPARLVIFILELPCTEHALRALVLKMLKILQGSTSKSKQSTSQTPATEN